MGVLAFYFGWPLGAIWSNLLASVISAALVWWRVRARMIAHHAELKAHVTATVAAAVRPQKRLAQRTPQRPGGDPE